MYLSYFRCGCFCLLLVILQTASLVAQDPIAKKAAWEEPTEQTIRAAFKVWLEESEASPQVAKEIEDYLQSVDWQAGELIDPLVSGIQIGDEEVARFMKQLGAADADEKVQSSHLLENNSVPDFVRSNVRLFYGRWLARHELFDESLAELEKLSINQVLDPATLLYYKGLMQHQLLQPKACIKTLETLLGNSDPLPRRYAVLARLMLADMKRLEKDSLDEISRMMSDIERRTDLSRSGTRVRGQEEDVVNKLDKLIEKLEEQQRQMQMAQGNGSNRSSAPAEREQRMAGKGSGDVRSKRQTDGGQWGNLDPAERDAALADMSKDLPPHYRSVIEEYFRKLADQTEKRE